ncbi:MAG: LytTR family DNA-binding domain-containing protein, partial [Clostridia bacterium]|nr:LytTR family DNA-binding domain-containing protein [Clostridia bacterium]
MGCEIKVALCDDEKVVLKEETEIAEAVLKAKGIKYIIRSFESPLKLLECEERFDIIILDVEMRDMDGISLAKRIKKKNDNCIIFFLTNYESYIDDAFNTHAFRFWTKPVDKKRLEYAIDSALAELKSHGEIVCAAKGGQSVNIAADNIIYIYSEDRKVFIVTTKGAIKTSDKFEAVARQLIDFDNFFVSHRGYCVNFKYIKD